MNTNKFLVVQDEKWPTSGLSIAFLVEMRATTLATAVNAIQKNPAGFRKLLQSAVPALGVDTVKSIVLQEFTGDVAYSTVTCFCIAPDDEEEDFTLDLNLEVSPAIAHKVSW